MAVKENVRMNRIKRFFGIDYKKTDDISDGVKKIDKEKSTDDKLKTIPFDASVKALLNYWLSATHDNEESWKHRTDLYHDMEMIYYNSALISRSMEMLADEVIQADGATKPMFVEAPEKQKKFIMEFWDNVKLFDLLRPTAVDIVQFGNAGWLPSFNDKGIDEVIPISVYDLKDRLEFTPYEVQEKLTKGDKLMTSLKGMDRMAQLIDIVKGKEKIAGHFKSYLFGFQIGDHIVPPWRFIHFRNMTNKSPFKPFGIPVFIHSVAPYRQYDAAMSFQVVARGLKYPKDKYELNIPTSVDATDKLQAAIEFLNELQNSGLNSSEKDSPGLNDVIITIRDLFEYSQIVPDIDLGKIDDIELLREDLMNSTFLPRYLIDPSDGGFGDSGVSLVQKWKPFARLVYRIQNILMSNVAQLTKIHMIHSGEFKEEEIDFIISMPYPESQVDRDLIDNQKDLLELSHEIIDALQDRITGGEELPPEIVKNIYQQFLPYDDLRIDKWVKDSLEATAGDGGEEATEGAQGKLIESEKGRKAWRILEEKVGKKNLKESIKNIIFEKRQEEMREGKLRGKHFYSSKNQYLDFPAEQLIELDKLRIKKLSEGQNLPAYCTEEVEYAFIPKIIEGEKEELVEEKHGRKAYKFSFKGKEKKFKKEQENK